MAQFIKVNHTAGYKVAVNVDQIKYISPNKLNDTTHIVFGDDWLEITDSIEAIEQSLRYNANVSFCTTPKKENNYEM